MTKDGFLYSFGDSKGAVNLMKILQKPEYQEDTAHFHNSITHKVLKVLTKYLEANAAIMYIPHKNTRETALKDRRDRFLRRVDCMDLPKVIDTHLRSAGITNYRKHLEQSQENMYLA